MAVQSATTNWTEKPTIPEDIPTSRVGNSVSIRPFVFFLIELKLIDVLECNEMICFQSRCSSRTVSGRVTTANRASSGRSPALRQVSTETQKEVVGKWMWNTWLVSRFAILHTDIQFHTKVVGVTLHRRAFTVTSVSYTDRKGKKWGQNRQSIAL